MIKKIYNRIVPRQIKMSLMNYRILSEKFGQYKSMKRWNCVDFDDKLIPWYTYPAIEYIKQLDLSDKRTFEYGSGASTLFWGGRCKKVVSVEDDTTWYEKNRHNIPDNVELHLIRKRQDYITAIKKYPDEFDIVIIDGSHRYECAVEALGKLREDGFIILDNSDWFEKTSELLRKSDLIEVDMSGFGPINGYTWTTSFYFKRNVKLVPAYGRQPVHGVGSLSHREV